MRKIDTDVPMFLYTAVTNKFMQNKFHIIKYVLVYGILETIIYVKYLHALLKKIKLKICLKFRFRKCAYYRFREQYVGIYK